VFFSQQLGFPAVEQLQQYPKAIKAQAIVPIGYSFLSLQKVRRLRKDPNGQYP